MTVPPPSSSCADHRRGDRTLGRAGHHRDLVVVTDPCPGSPRRRRSGRTARRGSDARPRVTCPATRSPGSPRRGRRPRTVRTSRAQSALASSSSISQSLTRSSRALAQRSSNTTAFLPSNDRRHQPRPVRAKFGGDQVDQLGIAGGRRHGDLIVEPQLTQHEAGRRCEHPVAAGDLVGELAQRGRVDGRAATATGGRECHRDAPAGGHGRDGGVDHVVDRGGVSQGALVQVAQ